MAGRASGRAWWCAAFVAVPAALAGLALVWPGHEIADDLRQRSEAALADAGLPGVTVAVDGRDVRLGAVPPGAEQAAVAAVAAVPGVRQVDAAAGPPPGQSPPAQSPPVPSPPLQAQLAGVLDAHPIRFAPDAADLSERSLGAVQRVAALLVADPAAHVLVEGHVADTPGPAETGVRLSERRAAVVADALVAAGVDRSRITTRGRGAERPLGTREESRRVEISVLSG